MKKQFCKLLFLMIISIIAHGFVFAEVKEGAAEGKVNLPPFTLEQLCENLAKQTITSGDFTQTKILRTNGRKLMSHGNFIFCPEGILWDTKKPFASSLIMTNDKIIQISSNGKKTVMDGKDNNLFASISETLNSVFSGDAEKLQQNFNCELYEEEGYKIWRLALTPKDSTIASVMAELLLSGTYTFENKDSVLSIVLDGFKMSEKDGNTILYSFTNLKYPEELSADEKKYFISE